jgi:hypothetical protein
VKVRAVGQELPFRADDTVKDAVMYIRSRFRLEGGSIYYGGCGVADDSMIIGELQPPLQLLNCKRNYRPDEEIFVHSGILTSGSSLCNLRFVM